MLSCNVEMTFHILAENTYDMFFWDLTSFNFTPYFNEFFIWFFQNWMSDLEIFTSLMAAIIHDFDHTGTTNNFHINSGSGLAILYNDRAVLENHHVSAFFR